MEPKRNRHDVIRLCAESGRHESAVNRYLDGLPVQRATRTLVKATARKLGLVHLLPSEAHPRDVSRTAAHARARRRAAG